MQVHDIQHLLLRASMLHLANSQVSTFLTPAHAPAHAGARRMSLQPPPRRRRQLLQEAVCRACTACCMATLS